MGNRIIEIAELDSQRIKLLLFKEWWNALPDESDDKLYMTDETIDRFINNNRD